MKMNEIITNDASPKQRLNAFERFTKTSVWPAYAGCVWALLYAVFVRFYQAAGGLLGIPGQIKGDPRGFYMVSYIAGLEIMVCGFILIALVKPWARVVPQWIPLIGGRRIHQLIILIPTLFFTSLLIAHGASGIVTSALHLVGVIPINYPGFVEVDVHKDALWELLIYEPWFLIMGILAGLTAAHYAQATGVPLATLRRGTVIYLIFVFLLTTLFVTSIVFDFVDKISF